MIVLIMNITLKPERDRPVELIFYRKWNKRLTKYLIFPLGIKKKN